MGEKHTLQDISELLDGQEASNLNFTSLFLVLVATQPAPEQSAIDLALLILVVKMGIWYIPRPASGGPTWR